MFDDSTKALGFFWQFAVKYMLPMLPGAVGATLALKFLGEGLSLGQRVTTFAAGMACVVYVAPAIHEAFNVTGFKMQNLIVFLVGLFGLAVCRELFREINEADIIGTLKRHYLGDK